MVAFVLIMAALLVIGLMGRVRRPPPAVATPGGVEVESAVDSLRDGLAVVTDLRFHSSIPRGPRGPRAIIGATSGQIEAAERLLMEAQRRSPRSVRLATWLGHLDLARHRYDRAERRYRTAVDLAPADGESRLGLGVTLAMMARTDGDPGRDRAWTLQAIAQFASVPETDSLYLAALYNRIVLLAQVGRNDEARTLAQRYRERDPDSPWSAALLRMLAEPDTSGRRPRPG